MANLELALNASVQDTLNALVEAKILTALPGTLEHNSIKAALESTFVKGVGFARSSPIAEYTEVGILAVAPFEVKPGWYSNFAPVHNMKLYIKKG